MLVPTRLWQTRAAPTEGALPRNRFFHDPFIYRSIRPDTQGALIFAASSRVMIAARSERPNTANPNGTL
jgi:hypothetical protein